MLAIRLPKDIEDRLAAMAVKTGRTKTFYVREAILEHIEDLEDYYLADERMSRYGDGTISDIDELAERYEMED